MNDLKTKSVIDHINEFFITNGLDPFNFSIQVLSEEKRAILKKEIFNIAK